MNHHRPQSIVAGASNQSVWVSGRAVPRDLSWLGEAITKAAAAAADEHARALAEIRARLTEGQREAR